jgi:hypothetical protein
MKALSIRQPWAWLICHGYKDIETVMIHAGQTMTGPDYESCLIFCAGVSDAACSAIPRFETLQAECGGLVGEVELVDCVTQSRSPWFCGKYGFVLKNALTYYFTPCKGTTFFFHPKVFGAAGKLSSGRKHVTTNRNSNQTPDRAPTVSAPARPLGKSPTHIKP